MPDIAQKIRKLRFLHELTQEYLAECAGISIRTYRNIETGRSSPTLKQLDGIAQALNCSLVQLLQFNTEALP